MPSSNYPNLSSSNTKSLFPHLHPRPPPDNYWRSVYLSLARSKSTSTIRCLLEGQRTKYQSRSLFRTTYPSSHRRQGLPLGIGPSRAGGSYPRRVLGHSRSPSPSRCQLKAQLTNCRQEGTSRTKRLSFHRRQGLPSSTAMRKGSCWVVETRQTLTIRSLSRGRQMNKIAMG